MKEQKTELVRKDFWSIDPADVYRSLETGEGGLSEQEAQRRLKTYGYNELPRQTAGWAQVFIRQLKNPIFIILVVASIVAGFFSQLEQSISILSMIALSVILGFYNEYKAEKIVENLRKSVSFKAVVSRGGKTSEIDSMMVVPGDVVSVYVGDIIPADIRLVESKELQVNESVLTGESFPVEKIPDKMELKNPSSQQMTNSVVYKKHCYFLI